jgi:hypothetical protein
LLFNFFLKELAFLELGLLLIENLFAFPFSHFVVAGTQPFILEFFGFRGTFGGAFAKVL